MDAESLCDAGASEAELVAAVVEHYRQCLFASEAGREALLRLGIGISVAKRFSLGLSDRSLGLRLPERKTKAGRRLRESLISLGIYRSSGHEHFVGSIVVPVCSPGGEIVALCARRVTDDDDSVLLFASGMVGGIFNEGAARDEVVLTESVIDALASISAGCEATLAPGRPGGFTRADLERLASSGVRRAVLVGDALRGLKERLSAVGIEAVQVACGRCLHGLLASSPDPSQAIACLLGSAASMARDRVDKAETPVVKEKKVSGDASELHLNFGTRRWRVRGAERNKVPDSVRVSLMVSDTETGEFHLDALDLCVAKARAGFVQAAGAELHTDEAVLRRELAEVLFATESALAALDAAGAAPEMSEEEREDALELLSDPELTRRVIADLNLLGVVGEETNLLVAYLATISRISEHPFGVVVQSSSAAGKSPPSPTPCASSCRKRTSRATRHSRARPSTTSARATSPTRCWRSRNNKAPPAPRTRSSCWSQRDGSRSPPRARTPPRGGCAHAPTRSKGRSPSCSPRPPPISTPSSPTASWCSASTRTRPRRAPSMPPSAGPPVWRDSSLDGAKRPSS
ncbi:MAG: hypothetical protein ACLQCU_06980 [Acidimicrobiales bacterium]